MGVIKHVDVYEDPNGWGWMITESDDNIPTRVVAHSPEERFKTKHEAMTRMFGLFFGDYDESFLALYAEFNPDGQFVETQDVGEPVGVQTSDTLWGDSDSPS